MAYDFTIEEDIHESQKIGAERDVGFVLLAIIALVVDYFALLLLLAQWFLPALALHALCFLLLLTYANRKRKRRKDARFVLIASAFMLVLGPIALGGILVSFFWYYISKEKSLSFKQWRDSIFPAEYKSLGQTVYERITFGREELGVNYSVTYLMDIITLGSDEEKREALFKISRYYDPCFAPMLRQALEDSHNMIRVLAAAAITKIKTTFFSTSMQLEKLKLAWPDNSRVLLELARHYDAYAFSGLLDDDQQEDNRRLALRYYQEFIAKNANHTDILEAHKLLGRLLLRMGHTEEACAHFETLRAEGIQTSDINFWYSECLFSLKRYAALRKLAAENGDNPLATDRLKYPDHIRGTTQLWSGMQENQAL